MSKENIIVNNSEIIRRQFRYVVNEINMTLDFTLRIDVLKELKLFSEILEIALRDVNRQMEKTKTKEL